MIKIIKNLFNILQSPYQVLSAYLSENPYSADYLLSQSKIGHNKWINEEIKSIVKYLLFEISSTASEGETLFQTKDTYLNNDIQTFYQKSSLEEWLHLQNKIEYKLSGVNIEYNKDKPYEITFDWSDKNE